MTENIRIVYEVWGAESSGAKPGKRYTTEDIFEAYRLVEAWLKEGSPDEPERIPGEAEAWIDKVEEFADGSEINRNAIRRLRLKANGEVEFVPV